MDTYLTRAESELLSQLLCLGSVIEEAIELYSSVDSVDKTFLTELRHARTRLEKAVTIRQSLLDPEAEKELLDLKNKCSYAEGVEMADQDMESFKIIFAAKPSKDILPAVLGLSNGNTVELVLNERIAKSILSELRRPNRNARGICAAQVGDDLVAVDMQQVATIQVRGLKEDALPKAQEIPLEWHPQGDGERERYRVECKCGAEYFCSMNAGRNAAHCRECKSSIFADRQADQRTDPIDGTGATLLTNRYWVPRPGTPKEASSQPETYQDPCNPFSEEGGYVNS